MQSLLSRVAEAHVCYSRVYTHFACNTRIRRPAVRLHNLNYSVTSTALYSTEPDPSVEFDAAHRDDHLLKPSDHDEHPPEPTHQDEHPPEPTDRDEHSPKRNEKVSAPLQGKSPPEEQQLNSSYRYREEMRPWGTMGAIQLLNSICDTEDMLLRHMHNKRSFNYVLRALHRSYDASSNLSFGYMQDYRGPVLAAVQLAVDHEQRMDNVPMREPLSTTQFERYHDMINQMVNRLIIQSYYDELPDDPMRARRNVESLDSAWTAIRLLRSEGYPKYNHPSVDPVATTEGREELADKIRMLFEAWNADNPGTKAKFQVAKMCYNLLVCPVPPSMHHYNLLVLGFSRKKAYKLVEIVVDSFLNYSRLRPTPQTMVCLLVHYRLKKDIIGFYGIIRRMMAIDNRGMLIRRRWYEDVVQIPALHQWANQPDVTTSLQANWVIERPSRGQDLYEALVSGLLSFDRVKDAVKVFVGSLQEKIGISVELFIYLLKHCRYSLDASAADLLARGLIENVDVVVALLLRDDCPRRMVEHLYPVLNMVDAPSEDWSEERAAMIWHCFSMQVDPKDAAKVKRIKTAMFIRHTTSHLTSLHKALATVRLLQRRPIRDPFHCTLIAQASLDKLARLEHRYAKLSGSVLKHQVLQQVTRRLQAVTWDLGTPERFDALYRHVAALMRTSMPRHGGGYAAWPAHLDRCDDIAAAWLHYRIGKMRGVMRDDKRFALRARLHLLTGQRLLEETERVLTAMQLPKKDWGSPDGLTMYRTVLNGVKRLSLSGMERVPHFAGTARSLTGGVLV